MKTLVVTEESLKAAMDFLRLNQQYNTADSLKMLCVPAPVEAEGWVEGVKKHALWLKVFNKDEFRLIQWKDSWMLYTWIQKEDKNTGFVGNNNVWMSPQEAQAWADALIAERDAGENKPEPFEGMGNYRNQQPTSPDHVWVLREDLEVPLRIIDLLLGHINRIAIITPKPCKQDMLAIDRLKATLKGKE